MDDTPEPPEWSMEVDHSEDPDSAEDVDFWLDHLRQQDQLDHSLPPPNTYKALHVVPAADDDEEEHTSWWPVNLAELFDGTHTPPKPTMCLRDDGQPLLYPGKCHAFNGESESGKSWAALVACVQAIEAGGHVLYLDFEDTADTVVTRLLALGAKPQQVLDLFHYAQPTEPVVTKAGKFTPANADLVDVLQRYPIALAVLDGVTEAMTLHGLDLLANADYAAFHGALPRRLASTGAAVVQIDHVTKSTENRGRWAIGAQHKLAAMDGAVFSFAAKAPFGLGRHGITQVSIEKDRPGQLRQHAKGNRIADLHLESDQQTHALAWRLEAPEGDAIASDGTIAPTAVMESVSRFLERNPQGMTKSAIRTGVTGSSDKIDLAIDLLLAGWIKLDREGQRHLHTVVHPYRQGDKLPTEVA